MPQDNALVAPSSSLSRRTIANEVAAVQHALASSSYQSLQQIEVNVQEDYIVLRGEVSSFYLKQLAQTFALKSVGKMTISNCLDVVKMPGRKAPLNVFPT